MNNPKYIVASILMLTIIGGLLALNPSIFAQAQSYDEDDTKLRRRYYVWIL